MLSLRLLNTLDNSAVPQTMLFSSLPVWLRVDPLSVLLLSGRDRKKRELELRDAEILEDEGDRLSKLLERTSESDPSLPEEGGQSDSDEIAG